MIGNITEGSGEVIGDIAGGNMGEEGCRAKGSSRDDEGARY
jgi:hypothetical protein